MNIDDYQLLVLLRSEPESGFRQLYSQYAAPLYWHIRRLVVVHNDAEDALQETFLRVFRSLDNFKGEQFFKSWIYQIATNEALRIISRRHPEQCALEEVEAEADALMETGYVDYSNLEAVRLQRAILSLPRKQQIVFNLRYYDELSYDEIATITDTNATSAKANYHYAKERIINYLKTHE